MRAIREKLRTHRGMTLTEVLVALLILSLATAGMAAGVSASLRVYRQASEASDAQLLASTLSAALMDELRYARDVSGSADDPAFTSGTFGQGVSFGLDDGYVKIGGKKLLSDAAYAALKIQKTAKEGGGDVPLVKFADGVFDVAFDIVSRDDRVLCHTAFSVRELNDV